MTSHEINLPGMGDVIRKAGTGSGGRAQTFLTNELLRLSDPYTPFDAGIMVGMARIVDGATAIEYNAPHTQYHWYGRLMVDAVTGSSWARAGTQKVLTPHMMSYKGGPLRGPRWVDRAFEANKDALIKSVEKVANQ